MKNCYGNVALAGEERENAKEEKMKMNYEQMRGKMRTK